ncbi:MAG: 30S ribosomal protein S27e [Candidatus Aenigmatarchaeota archaeon]|nr:MAG: 30S ribosomal protein S27e [Candidatus Aenigmarchaeota archaeon]
MEREIVKYPKSKFLLVECKKCGNKQIVFNKPATLVKCLKCGEEIAVPTGGKVRLINGKILKVLS